MFFFKLKQIIISLSWLLVCLNTLIGLQYYDQKIGGSIDNTLYYSPIIRIEFIELKPDVTIYQLKSTDIVVNSEIINHNDIRLIIDEDYYLDYKSGTVSFRSEMIDSLLALTYTDKWHETQNDESTDTAVIEIEYAVIPDNLLREFSFFTSKTFQDTLSYKTISPRSVSFSLPDRDLAITGSKTFGVTIGSDDDLSINQSLFLRIDGELSPNMWIQAQLSDSQSPLTPEGDTREISSLDQIFIRIYGQKKSSNDQFINSSPIDYKKKSDYEIAFGDLDLSFDNTHFINYWSRFEGVKAEWRGKNDFQAAVALSKGKQTTYAFNGQDGKQGPYYIRLPDVGTYVDIIPNSEEVYLNSVLMNRGTDYTINYAEGSITFTSKHFIDSNSRVYVRFQYSDEEYRQYKYLSGNRLKITDNFSAGLYLIIESDDHNNPLRGELTDDDEKILRESGDGSAWAEGTKEVDMGEGDYIKIMENDETYFRFVGINQGNYVLHFSYVGQHKGNYEQTSPGRFTHVGDGNGSWVPKRRLSAPEYKANYDILLQWKGDFWQIDNENIFTYYDRNRISDLDSNNNDGYATNWQIKLKPDYTNYSTELKVFYRFFSKYFEPFADIIDPSLYHNIFSYDKIDSIDISEIGTQIILEKRDLWNSELLLFRESGDDDSRFEILDIKPQESFMNENIVFHFALSPDQQLPQLNYRYRYYHGQMETVSVEYEDPETQDLEGIYLLEKHNSTQHNNYLNIQQTLPFIKLGGRLQQQEHKKNINHTQIGGPYNYETKDETKGLLFTEKRLDLGTANIRYSALNFFLSLDDNKTFEEHWKPTRKSLTIGGEAYVEAYEQRLLTSYSHRKVTTYPDNSMNYFDMAEINFNSNLFNRGLSASSNYKLTNTEFHPKVRELIYVGRNTGLYDSTGVFTEDGEYDYITIPVGDPEMSTEINTNFNIHLTPRMFIDLTLKEEDPYTTNIKKWLSRTQFESTIIKSENNRSDKKWDVYLLKPSVIMDEDNTIYGRSMNRHLIWIDIIPRRLLGRMMLQSDKTLDNRYYDPIKTRTNTDEFMFRFSRFINSDFEFTYTKRTEEESRYQSETQLNIYALDIRKRIDRDLNVSSLFSYSIEEGDRQSGGYRYKMNSYSFTQTITYFFQRKYRFFGRIEYRYNERKGSGFLSFLPEKREGSVLRWNGRLNYQLNPFTTASLNYIGNKYPLQDTVHSFKVEVRSEF